MKKNLSELYQGLSTILPTAYREWEEGDVPPLPYLIYYETGKNPWYADNTTYYASYLISVELYTEKKDKELEARLEAFFNAQNITLSNQEEAYWSNEHLHEVLYEFEIQGEENG